MKTFDTIIFGGSFDPIHEGHLSVIEELFIKSSEKKFGLLVIAIANSNPWKHDRELTTFDLRLEMIKLALREQKLPYSEEPEVGKICLPRFAYNYSYEFVQWWSSKYNGSVTWAVSEDISDQVKKWKNWDILDVPILIAPIKINIHASDVRSGKHPPLSAIKEFVKANNLYS